MSEIALHATRNKISNVDIVLHCKQLH
uniref:Uncharacterized protein n=1 Tax=Anguilla anguilla TaxID=7936 RepID=A0A0E9SVD2_ANGAN